jgi:quinolinate synthase
MEQIMRKEILKFKNENNAVILAHVCQQSEVQELIYFDSLKSLSG